jgi:hypothetical protein
MTDLVKSISIDNMLNQRQAIVAKMASARENLREAQTLCNAQGVSLSYIIASRHDYGRNQILQDDGDRDSYLREFTQRLDAQLWQRLMHESGLRTLMDAKAREEWDKAIADVKTPALTRENIEATFEQLHNARGEMFERGVIEVFRSLSWDYKSNLPHKFGKRVVVSYFMDSYGITCGYSRADRLADLERCLHMLDSKPVPDHRQGIVQLCGDIQRNIMRHRATDPDPVPARIAEDGYFKVKWFKNRNGHFYFKRQDLVDKLNAIIAKHYPGALPAEIR